MQNTQLSLLHYNYKINFVEIAPPIQFFLIIITKSNDNDI